MYAIVDVETTGGLPLKTRIIEIAIIILQKNNINSIFNAIINPQTTIPSFITRLTGISNSMTRNAPTFREIAPEILKLTQNTIFVAHNARFDYACINAEMIRAGFSFSKPLLCTLELSRKAFPQIKKYNLNNLCKVLNIPNTQPHRAKSDAIATANLLLKIMQILPDKLIKEQIKAHTLTNLGDHKFSKFENSDL